MNYSIRDAKLDEYELLKNYKRHSIFDYATDLNDEEIAKINNYIDDKFSIDGYKMIIIDDKVVGAYLFSDTDELLLDEIFIEEDYRNRGIATSIIKNLIDKYKTINLWVYKENKAVKFYKSLGFKIEKVTNSRYYMVYR